MSQCADSTSTKPDSPTWWLLLTIYGRTYDPAGKLSAQITSWVTSPPIYSQQLSLNLFCYKSANLLIISEDLDFMDAEAKGLISPYLLLGLNGP
eukprot:scaffold78220_cov16-Tisochrysis_lutea.AAC.1